MSSLPILVLNSGSSSIKFAMYEAMDGRREKLFEGAVDGIGTSQGKFWIKDAANKKLVDQTPPLPSRTEAFALVAEALNSGSYPRPAAIGHRVVCAGPTIRENQRVTPELIDALESYADLAPLHTPIAVYILRQALRLFPGVPNFSCLDTYFHRDLTEEVYTLPLPPEYGARGVRRYGFHGLSYESIVHQLEPNVPARMIVAHLGNGSSLSAVRKGRGIDTSMSMTPFSGSLSGSRTGDMDPGVMIYLLRRLAEQKPSTLEAADELEAIIGKRAGLLGVSGLSNDMRSLREAIAQGNTHARLAVTLFTRSIAKYVAIFFAELGGLDLLVFTGGIGENDGDARAEICAGLGALGITLDAEKNKSRGMATISANDSPVAVRVIPPAEDLMIVNHVVRLMT